MSPFLCPYPIKKIQAHLCATTRIYYIYHGKNEKTMAKNNIDVDLNAVNLIASTTLLHGEIKSETDIRIDGELVGNLTTQGRLIIGPKGKIEGDVK